MAIMLINYYCDFNYQLEIKYIVIYMSCIRFAKIIESSLDAELYEAVLNKNKIKYEYDIVGPNDGLVYESRLSILDYEKSEALILQNNITSCLFKSNE